MLHSPIPPFPLGCHPVGYKRQTKKWHVFITPTIPLPARRRPIHAIVGLSQSRAAASPPPRSFVPIKEEEEDLSRPNVFS